MTDSYKGFLVTLEKEKRDADAESIITALRMIKGVFDVQPYVAGIEDYMLYSKGYYDAKKEVHDVVSRSRKEKPD